MNEAKLKVLVLYSCSEWPFRKTFKAFLESFQKYSNHEIVYVNFPFFFPKQSLASLEWDLIIYTHSFTAPWNRTNFLKKIALLEEIGLKAERKIAFFQDEYFNLDLTNLFLEKMRIDSLYTVAPDTEWQKLYPHFPSDRINQYLTGYIENEDVINAEKNLETTKKDIGISYRTAYPGVSMACLGDVGWLKYEVAEFGKLLNVENSDVQVGTGFLTGDDWFKLLARSKFTLGTPSGSNILDRDGTLAKELSDLKSFNRKELIHFLEEKGIPQDFQLEVISPRIFESGMFNCCQILVEGEYNSILEKYKHYIPIKRDLSNIDEVRSIINDESKIKIIVSNFRKDIIDNYVYSYQHFIDIFFKKQSVSKKTTNRLNVRFRASIMAMNIGLHAYNSKLFKKLKIK